MPRFSAKLAAALGIPAIDTWPDTADLVEPGSRCTLSDTRFFGTEEQR
jgi:methionyl-tRNA synthetase